MKKIIWDAWAMILQTGDGGDSAANIGTYHVYLQTRRNMGHDMFFDGPWENADPFDFAKALAFLSDPKGRPGLYRRHPEPGYWGARTNTMSRDQTIPLLSAMALYGMRGHVWAYIKAHAKRGFLFATNTTPNWSDPVRHDPRNFGWGVFDKIKFFFGWDAGHPVYAFKMPDITGPEFWALELRGIYSPWCKPLFFPLLCALDCFTLLGSFSKVYGYAKDPTNSDDRNHINTLLVGLQICPTPVMSLAAKVYSIRPCTEMTTTLHGVQSSLDHYYRAENSPPLNELARPIVKHFFP